MEQYKDSELIFLIKESNHSAFEELHRRFWHSLYRIAYKKIGDQEETNDLLQEMFMELWEKRETLDFNNAVNNWLRNRLWYKVAIYFRYKGFKQKHKENFLAFLKSEEESAISFDSIDLKEADFFYEEILATINNCIEDMPERMKRIFLMSRSENQSVKEIASNLNLSPKTVKAQLERASSRLKRVAELHHPAGMEMLVLLWLINY